MCTDTSTRTIPIESGVVERDGNAAQNCILGYFIYFQGFSVLLDIRQVMYVLVKENMEAAETIDSTVDTEFL